jgi:small subunit ribosomal protein S20
LEGSRCRSGPGIGVKLQELQMANHASALKAHRQSVKRKGRNKGSRSELRTGLKNFSEKIDSTKAESAHSSLSALYSLVDKAVQKKALSKNAASRQKSRLTRRLNAAVAATNKE